MILRTQPKTDMQQLVIGDVSIDFIRKDIKNLHLVVYSPSGKVRISAPLRMNSETIRTFVISKMKWIKKQQSKLANLEREAAKEYVSQESHYYLGRLYLLKVIEQRSRPKVALTHETIELHIRPNTAREKRKEIMAGWYRQRLREIIPGLITQYEEMMKVNVAEFAIKRMKTRWGSCNLRAKRIWLNLELAKKPIECLEYIVVHELAHLIERRHGTRFSALMDMFLPKWRLYKEMLNKRPLRHEYWNY